MMKKVSTTVGLALALLLGAAGTAFAQGTLTGNLQGTVRDGQRVAVPGVTVTVSSTALVRGKAGTTTDASGIYRFPSLPPGTYLLEAELPGFKKVQQPGVRIGLGQALAIDLTLTLESVKAEVVVSGEAPIVSVVSNSVSNNFGQEFLEKQPLPRNYYNIVRSAPGVNVDALASSGSAMLAYGGTGERQNAFTLDGVNVADSGSGSHWILPSIQWMEEVQISGLGANAEYGGFTGGVINGVTKSGGNTFHGGVEVYYQPDSWTSCNTNCDATNDTFKFQDYSASLGGPLLKDKLWFFASGEYWRQVTTPVGALDTSDRHIPRYLGKLTWQLSEKNKISLMGEYDAVTNDRRGISALVLPEAAQKQYGPGGSFSVNWESIINSSNFLNVKVTGYDGRDDYLPYKGPGVNGRIDADGLTGLAWLNADFQNLSHRHSVTLDASWSLFKDGLFGKDDSHSFKFGALYEEASASDIWRRNGGFTYYDDSSQCPGSTEAEQIANYFKNPACGAYYVERGYGEYDEQGQQKGFTFYAQDSMRLKRLTVNLGARYTHYDAGWAPGRGDSSVYKVDFVDPRIGLVWDVFGNARTAVKAHWGRYHSSMFLYLYDREASGQAAIPDQDCYFRSKTGLYDDCDPKTSISARMGTVKHPYVDESLLTFEHQLGKEIAVGVDLVDRRFRSFMAMVNTNQDYTLTTATGNPLTGGTLPIYNLNSPPVFVLTSDNGSYRDYQSVILRLDKRYAHGWQLRSSLVYTDLKGNILSNDGYAIEFRDRNGLTNADGRIDLAFSKWEFKLSGSVDLPFGILASGQYTYLSGQYWSPYVRISGLNYNSSIGRSINLVSRGSEQFDDRHLLDLRVAWGTKIAGTAKVELSLECFNALNRDTVLDNDARWGTYSLSSKRWTSRSAYGTPVTIEQPRQFRAGARISF